MTMQPGLVATQHRRESATYRLLLMSCSRRKRDMPGTVLALQRYDGPAFRVVRRYLRESDDPLLHICVLSAEHGLITSDDRIADYDRKMDTERAAELRESVLATLKAMLRQKRYAEVFVCTSRMYLNALQGIDDFHREMSFAAPGQGKKLASLRSWLRGARNGG